MKFERLPVPHLPLPDLVAFNGRVHDRLDPAAFVEVRAAQENQHIFGPDPH